MVYTRPDADALIAALETLLNKAPDGPDAETILSDYYAVVPQIRHFQTMQDLALFRFSMNTADPVCTEEYDYCDEQAAIVTEKLNALYAAYAATPFRDALERAYFGEGFFLDYEDYADTDEAFFALKKQENDLLFDYYQLSYSLDDSSYYGIKQGHDAIGNQFIALAAVRRQIAEAKGYENYIDYCYDCVYRRDYTAVQAREFLDLVKTYLAPLVEDPRIFDEYADYTRSSPSLATEALAAAAEKMGGPIADSFRFFEGHRLYDITSSYYKQGIGYTSYLDDYEAPFVFIDPDSKDLMPTLFHEFGHFTDFYVNYGMTSDLETAETYSQAMQYLAYAYADPFTDEERAQNLRATLANLLLYSILREGAYADFELQVYALPTEELTLDRIDAIYEQCMNDYGLGALSGAQFRKIYWIAYGHFFNFPGYVVSYAVSALSAVEIARMEAQQPGAGVDAFCRLLSRSRNLKFSAVIKEAQLQPPFTADAMQETADFLKSAFAAN